jgi:2-polyprenyl-3-methyl-5-hydroxy-6-metoxy-1,4-benzoquinol methylase
MSLNPPTQNWSDGNLRARQRLWEAQVPRFDLIGWVLGVAGFDPQTDRRVLAVGCGNGNYLTQLHRRGVAAIGCDMSFGILAAARPHPTLMNADVGALPVRSASFDLVLAPHMLYHVDDREQAAAELRCVTAPAVAASS